jgi:glutaredoxin 3
MPPITVYTKPFCPYCTAAKALLAEKGAPFAEIDVGGDRAGFEAMAARTGRRTVPQIFIGERHVGGCDDLHAADRRGDLDRWLAA